MSTKLINTSWIETHHEVVAFISFHIREELPRKNDDVIYSTYKNQGTGGLYELAENWTNEFENINSGREWDGEFFDEIERFLKTKTVGQPYTTKDGRPYITTNYPAPFINEIGEDLLPESLINAAGFESITMRSADELTKDISTDEYISPDPENQTFKNLLENFTQAVNDMANYMVDDAQENVLEAICLNYPLTDSFDDWREKVIAWKKTVEARLAGVAVFKFDEDADYRTLEDVVSYYNSNPGLKAIALDKLKAMQKNESAIIGIVNVKRVA